MKTVLGDYRKDKALSAWANRIHKRMGTAVEAIIAVGDELKAAKKDLPGEFERLFRDHENPIPNALPFTSRKARMLMAIADQPLLRKGNHGSVLPPSWRTLYELSTLPVATLNRALQSGAVVRIHEP